MRVFAVLAGEAVRDAARRRIVAVIVVVSLLSLMLVDSCTACGTGRVVVDGQVRELVDLAGFTGAATGVVLGLWCIALAGVLGAEHLAETLEDGSASLTLARPVGRTTFALARLAGALAIAGATAAVLLGGTALLLRTRGGLPLAPAATAGAAVALGGLVVGALAMTASLWLPRLAAILLGAVLLATVVAANALGFVAKSPGGLLGLVDRVGPPLATTLVLAVDPWITQVHVPGDPLAVWARLAAWAAASLALLALAFRRVELGR